MDATRFVRTVGGEIRSRQFTNACPTRWAAQLAWPCIVATALVSGAAHGADVLPPPVNSTPPSTALTLSFVNDVLPVLSKAGCNQGTCHGAAAGKGGFRLSLRGFAPEQDYLAIVRHEFGRRLSLGEPEQSLLLAKPSLAIPHQGGRMLERGSPGYQILAAWVRAGALPPTDDEPQATSLAVEPAIVTFEPTESVPLTVQAGFSDGTSRDVTAWTRWDSSDAGVASVNNSGATTAHSPGKTALAAAYQSLVAAVEVSVPFPAPSTAPDYAALRRANSIDALIISEWQKLRLWPSPTVDDRTLYRRLALDITGTLPTVAEVEAYAADQRPDKRQRAINDLLARPEFVDAWAQKWEDVFRASREWIGEKGVWAFDRYLRDAIRRDVPWDVVVRDLIAGSGDSSQSGPANFFRLQKVFNEAELWPLTAAETTAQTFLGLRFQCARCHNHPFDRWTQSDYYGMASFFARTTAKPLADGGAVIFERASGDIVHPRLGRPLAPKPPDGPAMADDSPDNRREYLAAWATAADNPFFARATANRVWRHFMGRGLIEPVDDLRATNPASNPALLDALARDLVEHRFDVRHLIRQILETEVYALSSTPTSDNVGDTQFYSHWQPKRLTAEQLLDALATVTGVPEKFAGLPSGFRAQQLPDTKVASAFLDMFGRPLRRSACECERVQEPNLAQALELMHSDAVDSRVRSDGGLIARLLAADPDDQQLLDEIYGRTLARHPRADEQQTLTASLADTVNATPPENYAATRREFFEDLLWAVLNSKEFVFNH